MIRYPQRSFVRLLPLVVVLASALSQGQLAHQGPASAIALSQTVAPYDVSSIKQNKSGRRDGWMNLHDDVFTANDMSLEAIIGFAYDTHHITGLTGPVTSLHFDVVAKVRPVDGSPPDLTADQLHAMTILLLADRFHLKAHTEPRILPVYDLVVDKGGPKLKLVPSEGNGGSWDRSMKNTQMVLTGKNDSMADLADALSDFAILKVVDKTGLAGTADITLEWSNKVDIFTAVKEQLGLKLQPSKGPVDTLVIDHVEIPSEN